MDLPGLGCIPGHWDLRTNLESYLAKVEFSGKRVLDIGTANGCLCFEMEKRGASVVGFDLSEDYDWDIVPFGGKQDDKAMEIKKENIRRLNNAWWLAHRLLNSRAKVVYGSVYQIPSAVGQFDIAVLGCILLHLRDPFQALAQVAPLVKETIIVADIMPEPVDRVFDKEFSLTSEEIKNHRPYMTFIPEKNKPKPNDTWWQMHPYTVACFLEVLGFDEFSIVYHKQFCVVADRHLDLYSLVAKK